MNLLDGIQLIIFDKDGTLIDFDAMWGAWVTELAQRLASATGLSIADRLFHAMGFDPDSRRVAADGPLAVTPMAILRALTVGVLHDAGFSRETAEVATANTWQVPDPMALARPLVDLPALFSALRGRGVKIAVATTDDRVPTEATFAGLGIASFVDALICADDGVPVKPAPDMVWDVCRTLGIPPGRAAVVGDSVADLQMGRAAGVGLAVGVLSGVSSPQMLEPFADVLLPTVASLVH